MAVFGMAFPERFGTALSFLTRFQTENRFTLFLELLEKSNGAEPSCMVPRRKVERSAWLLAIT
ncbi:hypothetical protein ASE05_24665 [Mesorhizobium sp. Root172]|jgi:hypothetical protein|nr:hypothetical protein ASE05_24665 [Mesorhizobium sp. Root172]